MPFDEEPDDTLPIKNVGLKKVSSQKSMFDLLPKKTSPEEFERRVSETQEKASGYKREAALLTKKFIDLINSKTLKQNKNALEIDFEREVIADMVKLASTIDNDVNEQEGMGSLSWITLLLKVVLSQRNKINQLEYSVDQLIKQKTT
jgi:hypothetical protein